MLEKNTIDSFGVSGSIRSLIKTVKDQIVPAVLEHEEIQGISGNIPGAMRGRMGSVTTPGSPSQKPITILLQELTNHHKVSEKFAHQ